MKKLLLLFSLSLLVPVLIIGSCTKKEDSPATTAKVTYDANGGKFTSYGSVSMIDTLVKIGDYVPYPSDPTRPNYVFKGWCEDKECKTLWSWLTKVEKDITLYAKWEDDGGGGGGGGKKTLKVEADVSGITSSSATIWGYLTIASGASIKDFGVACVKPDGEVEEYSCYSDTAVATAFSYTVTGLDPETAYGYYAYALDGNDKRTECELETFVTMVKTSNCYIVTESGEYSFPAVKGNSDESVGEVASVAVLWESFGSSDSIEEGAIINSVSFSNGCITYATTAAKGNALIAAKDSSGTVLWSWHIWCTDQPEEQVYYGDAGTMMDRNLGATDTIKGDVKALGLQYQWGRKDPFLGADGKESSKQAASTLENWQTKAASECLMGDNNTLSYSIMNPTTYITSDITPFDWYCTNENNKNDSLWITSDGEKTIYDPCPAGWRVPEGGSGGVWCTAFSTTSSWTTAGNWDDKHKGMDFGITDKTLVVTGQCWYPAAGFHYRNTGLLNNVGGTGTYWSCTPYYHLEYDLFFDRSGIVAPSNYYGGRALGFSVRCVEE